MKNQTTTKAQSEELIRRGVSTPTPSIYWARRSHGSALSDDSKGEWFLSLHKDFMVAGFTNYEVVRAFTTSELMGMLPRGTQITFGEWYKQKQNGWELHYVDISLVGDDLVTILYIFINLLLDKNHKLND